MIIVIWQSLKRKVILKYGKNYSDEQFITEIFLNDLKIVKEENYFVDLACQDGVLGSQTIFLAKKGWNGILFEADPVYFSIASKYYKKFENVRLVRDFITPQNVLSYLDAASCPKQFAFLSLDIDSYDYFILDAILKMYRPHLMCIEINENFPPPIRFSIKFCDEFVFNEDNIYNHFQGMSIAMANDLLERYRYKIVKLEYNNLFCVPIEANIESLSVDEAYKIGYMNRDDKYKILPWNKDVRDVQLLSVDEQINYWENRFKNFGDVFILKSKS
jgi:hypothetical protein